MCAMCLTQSVHRRTSLVLVLVPGMHGKYQVHSAGACRVPKSHRSLHAKFILEAHVVMWT